jgi:hypothetical protein
MSWTLQAFLPLEGDLDLDGVLNAYRAHMKTPLARRAQSAILYRDMIALSAWAGDIGTANSLLAQSLQLPTDDPSFQHVGGALGFRSECQDLIVNHENIQSVVKAQITHLGVEQLPVSLLVR